MTDIETMSDDELIQHWADVVGLLRRRGIVRTSNNPVADIAERAAADRLGLTLETRSNRGYDGVDAAGLRYEVKSRRVTASNKSRQLSPLRGLEDRHFDFLVAVIYDQDLSLQEMWKIPVEHVLACAKYRSHVNGHIVHAKGGLLDPPAERIV